MKKKILLVCYHFPPNPGIGGRKWSFLTKHLLKNDIEVHVLTKYPASTQFSLWQEMTKGVCLHFFKSNYPRVLEYYPKNIWEKATYRLYLFLFKIIAKSNYHDRGFLQKSNLIREIKNIMKAQDINNVIITGAPFSFLYYGSLIKANNNKINYIADIRDSWIKGNYFGFDKLNDKIKTEEVNRLRSVLQYADKVLVPYPILKEEYTAICAKNHVRLFPHAVDTEYIKQRSFSEKSECVLVNFGSQYEELHDTMINISNSIGNSSIRIDFYTDDRKYEQYFAKSTKRVNFIEQVSYQGMFDLLSSADAALLFVNRHIKEFLSTKYIESIAARIPIVLIGEKGFVSDFIEYNKLGIFIDAKNLESEFIDIPERLRTLEYNTAFDISPYTFEKQAKEIIELLD